MFRTTARCAKKLVCDVVVDDEDEDECGNEDEDEHVDDGDKDGGHDDPGVSAAPAARTE